MDTLSKRFEEQNKYDVILANPPFKGSIDKGDVHESLTRAVKSTKTELLFVLQMERLLQNGGRCAVIVPDGVLFGSSNAHVAVRKHIVEKCQLEGVISMPSGVFKPYAGVSTAIMVFTKGGETDKVWFYDMQADGFTLDDKRDRTSSNDIPDVIEKWNKRANLKSPDKSDKWFWVEKAKIVENEYDLTIQKHKTVTHVENAFEAPVKILTRILALESEITKELEDIRGVIS
jgi:type I restriction enzyme M protein